MVLRRTGTWPVWGQWRDELDRQFTDLWSKLSTLTPAAVGGGSYPAVNLWEQGDDLVAEAELPGVKSEDLEISVVGVELMLKGRRPETVEQGAAYHRHERGTGTFTRVVRLPVEVDGSKVEAALRDGVLSIRLPKSEAAKPRKIKVSAAK